MRHLTDNIQIGGQISVQDLERFAEQGVSTVINNRPDHEDVLQPLSEDLKAKAEALGLSYHHIPMSGGVSPDMIKSSEEAYKSATGGVVAFCKSGGRSAALWCFAHAGEHGVDAVLSKAGGAGYNLEQLRSPLSTYLEQTQEN